MHPTRHADDSRGPRAFGSASLRPPDRSRRLLSCRDYQPIRDCAQIREYDTIREYDPIREYDTIREYDNDSRAEEPLVEAHETKDTPLYDAGQHTVQQIADLLRVPRSTVYGP